MGKCRLTSELVRSDDPNACRYVCQKVQFVFAVNERRIEAECSTVYNGQIMQYFK